MLTEAEKFGILVNLIVCFVKGWLTCRSGGRPFPKHSFGLTSQDKVMAVAVETTCAGLHGQSGLWQCCAILLYMIRRLESRMYCGAQFWSATLQLRAFDYSKKECRQVSCFKKIDQQVVSLNTIIYGSGRTRTADLGRQKVTYIIPSQVDTTLSQLKGNTNHSTSMLRMMMTNAGSLNRNCMQKAIFDI